MPSSLLKLIKVEFFVLVVIVRLPIVVKKSRKLEEDCSFETSYDLMNQRIKVKLLEMMYPVAVVKIFYALYFRIN